MNPKKAYKFKKKIEITSVLLCVLLISQVFYFFNNDVSFKLPNYLVEFISKRISPENKIIIDELFVKLNNTILLDRLRLDSTNSKYEFSNLKIKYLDNFNFDFDNIKILEIKEVKVSTLENDFYFEDISILRIKNKLKYYFKYSNKFTSLKFSGIIHEDKLLFLSDLIIKSNNESNKLISILNKIIETQIKRIPIETKNFQILINCNIDNDVSINIHQSKFDQNEPKFVDGLTGMLKFPIREPQNMIFSLYIHDQIIYFMNTSLNIVNFKLKRIKLNNQEHNSFHHYIISFKKMEFDGKVNGKIEGFSTYIEDKNNTIKTLIIADSNESRLSNEINFNSLDNRYKLSGTSRFIPKNFNLLYNDNNQSRKIIDGDEFSINFRNKKGLICLIDFNTINFSVLGSPFGDFEGNGMLDNNYSFKFPKSKVKMGNSKVKGSFIQKFHPLRYSFNVSGICDPNDLNNWMGNWWKKIWLDFQFHQNSIPHGNFQIDGVWGENDKTLLFGSVKTGDISFRNLKLKQSVITVKSDVNSTEISSPKIIHDCGIIRGSVKFSRINHKLNSLTYHLDGNLPINDSTKVFGSIIEDYINDFNTSDINIISSGEIPFQLDESNKTTTTNPAYEINFSTEQNGTWNGVFYDTFRGTIRSNDDNLTIHLPEIISGETKLSLKAHFNEDDKYSLSLNLKDAPFDKIINSVVDYESSKGKSYSHSTFDPNGNLNSLVNLSFNGNGTMKDYSSLKGSGKITVNDKNLRQIHLLGTLSESLNILPIPLPIGTLNFNKLSGHFNLENDHIYFDDLLLTSLLSKLSSSGSINFNSGTINFTSDLNIIGNLFPIIDNIDPLSIISDIKLSGHWENPNWKIQLSEIK